MDELASPWYLNRSLVVDRDRSTKKTVVFFNQSETVPVKLILVYFNGVDHPRQVGLLSLQHLDLSENNLIGSIPSEFGELLHLRQLDMAENRLSGTMPEEFVRLRSLERLELSSNLLAGGLPCGLGDCSRFPTYSSDNMALMNLSYVSLYYNKLDRPLPESEGVPVSLRWTVTALLTLLTEMWKLTGLESLNLALNR